MRTTQIVGSFLLAALVAGIYVWFNTAAPGPGVVKTAAVLRAERRLYDGAPPVIPHGEMGASCISCHNEEGIEVAEVGYAPPTPHELTAGMSAMSLCTQCHVYQETDDLFVENGYVPFRQDLRKGRRLNPIAPPVIPHSIAMRENCLACHSGTAAREEIRTTHPERSNCRQCHVPATVTDEFVRGQ